MNESFRPPTAASRRIAARREAVRTLIDEGHSGRKIAEILGVDEGTVRNDLKAENSALDRKISRQTKAEAGSAADDSALREELEKDLGRVAQVAQMLSAALVALRPAGDCAADAIADQSSSRRLSRT
jgi:transposase